jgi:hypothetical protein
MKPDQKKSKKISRWINLVVWSIVGFFLLGYLPTYLLQSSKGPICSMVAAAMAVIPYASWIARPVRSALVSLGLGLLTGLAVANVLARLNLPGPEAQAMTNFASSFLLATVGLCTAVGAIFGYLGMLRQRRTEREWQE